MSMRTGFTTLTLAALCVTAADAQDSDKLSRLKQEAERAIEARAKFTQQMVDQIFSYGELGFQEFETSKYLVGLLRENGFEVEEGVAGIPTAWVATWGSGKPVISLGTDLDDIPQASQMPGVACHTAIVTGAPGHGHAGRVAAVARSRPETLTDGRRANRATRKGDRRDYRASGRCSGPNLGK